MKTGGENVQTWHLITGEYPPQSGGVSDYTRLVAQGFVQAGDNVHVWAPYHAGPVAGDAGIVVHRLPDHFGRRGLCTLDAGIRRQGPNGLVLVQYVPHMYGYRAMNLGFVSWLRLRAPRFWVMFHEVAFGLSRRQKLAHNILGGVNHVMAMLVASAADKIFVSVPRWGTILKSRCLVRRPAHWLPVPSNVPTDVDSEAVRRLRAQLLGNSAGPLLGHFGTFQASIAEFLTNVVPRLLHADGARRVMVIGRGSEAFARSLGEQSGDLRDRIIARENLPGRDVAEHLAACDVLLQPYTDGVSGRRGSAMAGLALGRPIVTTEGEATEPLWRQERLVETVSLNDIDGYIQRVESLLGSAEERTRLGDRARLGYEANFSCRKTIATLREMRCLADGPLIRGARRRMLVANPPRLGILRDFAEEGWPSMDLCAEMLIEHLRQDYRERLTLVEMCPPFRRRLQRVPWLGRQGAAFNADRLLNRLWDYPRYARRRRVDADVFHVVDHSYAQVLAELPAERTGIYCHDLDTFRCVLTPDIEPRPRWFRAMARRILKGFQKAAIIFHSTNTVREQIVLHQLVDPGRLVLAPLGFAAEFRPDPPADAMAQTILQSIGSRPYLLHVGSCIPRKRIDVLLNVFAHLRAQMPDLRLVKVGGEWTAEQRQILSHHGLAANVAHVSGIGRPTLANLYRNAALVLMPSEAEGFGIPVVEALACGVRVLASDLVVFRDVAGTAARYAAVGDIEAFAHAAKQWLQEPEPPGAIDRRIARAQCFSWQRHAQIIGDAYLRLTA